MECEVHIDVLRLEQVLEFKYLGCVLDESSADEAEFRRKVVRGRRVTGATRSLVNARGLQLEFARVLHVPILMYGSEIWKEKERFSIRVVQMDNLRG